MKRHLKEIYFESTPPEGVFAVLVSSADDTNEYLDKAQEHLHKQDAKSDFKTFGSIIDDWTRGMESNAKSHAVDFAETRPWVKIASLLELHNDLKVKQKFYNWYKSGKVKAWRSGPLDNSHDFTNLTVNKRTAENFAKRRGETLSDFTIDVKDIGAYTAAGEAEIFVDTGLLM